VNTADECSTDRDERIRELEATLERVSALPQKWRFEANIRMTQEDGVNWHSERDVGHLDCADELEAELK
jgi:hypothetical protein